MIPNAADVRPPESLIRNPGSLGEAVLRWSVMNQHHRQDGDPDRNDEYLLYQILAGAWPIETERVLQYMEKACREAKVHTNWTSPNPAYEAAVAGFVKAILGDESFTSDLQAFVARLVKPGQMNSLAQTLVKLTAPGIPDLYQGTEPGASTCRSDNRRPVDYELRRRLLSELSQSGS
jgi:(1->4)-alpha-D-glucan 1-alpha-D-glucosylmutase